MFKTGFQVNPDTHSQKLRKITCMNPVKKLHTVTERYDCIKSLPVRNQKLFDEMENAGSKISFRCIASCHSCKLCRDHNHSEILSVREAVEQDLINNFDEVEVKNRVTIASLSLMQNPSIKVAPSKDKALQIISKYKN